MGSFATEVIPDFDAAFADMQRTRESSHRLFVCEREASLVPTMALRDAAIVDYRQSFDEIVHQRLKQAGYDLPRLRMLIGEALSSSVISQESAVRWQETTGRTSAL